MGASHLALAKSIYYFLFYKLRQKNKQTNRKIVGRDTATAVANYSGPEYYYY